MTTNTRERQARVADLWQRRPDWTEAEVIAELDDQLALEQQQQDAIDARTAVLAASLDSMMACVVCGANAMGKGLCPDCSRVRRLVEDERALATPVDGQDRRALVEAWLARTGS